MRTFNRNNTENVKQARKQSKELRKLRMKNGYLLTLEDDSDKIKGAKYNFEDFIGNEEYSYENTY